ncbi:MAG: hypothetical protein Roseis2KO_58800 [Roseivirga sp.]
MTDTNKLLSREELMTLWQSMAQSFNTKLEITVDNATALAMRFNFESKFGLTEIGIKDAAGSSTGGYGMGTSIITECQKPLSKHLKINLPPLFSGILESFRKDVSLLYLNNTKYWVKSDAKALREAITLKKTEYLKNFDSLYLKTYDNTVLLKTTDFLGRQDQIQAFARLHMALVG